MKQEGFKNIKTTSQADYILPDTSRRNNKSQLVSTQQSKTDFESIEESAYKQSQKIRKKNQENNNKNFLITYRDYASRFSSIENQFDP